MRIACAFTTLSLFRYARMTSPADPASLPQPQRLAAMSIGETVDARMLALMRCILAFSAFAIVFIDASDTPQWSGIVRASLGFYCLYSSIVALASRRSGWPKPHRAQHWADVLFYVYLTALTGGAASIFFNFFLFAILVAAFTRGFREGLLVSWTSLLAYAAVTMAMAPPGNEFEFDRAMIRAVYLFVFGSMISYWGGYESLLKRRLALLNDINNTWSPRLGADRVISANLRRLLDFYDADACVLVVRPASAPAERVMYRSLRTAGSATARPIEMTLGASEPLLALPASLAAFHHAPDGPWRQRWRGHGTRGADGRKPAADYRRDCAALANLLDTASFITVPYAQHEEANGRLFLTGARHGFGMPDIGFLAQAAAAIATVAANTMLMEELISRASEQERRKISRDLHDSTIQPYIGLKLALDALLRDAPPANPLAPRLREIAEMTGMTIRDLRDYAASFKGKAEVSGDSLLTAIGRRTDNMRRFYGIEVDMQASLPAGLGERAATEIFHIVSEGLSNILRHTHARKAFVRLGGDAQNLHIEIGNAAPQPAAEFTPRSIHDRVLALGGKIVVEHSGDGYTVVRISIPF